MEDMTSFGKKIDANAFINEIKSKIGDVDKSIIFPSLWSNGKKAE